MSLGQAIRKRRKAMGLTLQQLSAQVGADSGNLSRIERGAQGVSEAMLRKLSGALKCTPAFLYNQADAVESPAVQTASSINTLQTHDFVRWFRSATPYIHAFGGRLYSEDH